MIEGQENVTWEQWRALASAAEAAGLDGMFRSDHYAAIHRGSRAGSLDAWLTLAALAGQTERIRLGTLVSPVTFRHVSVLAKSVVTADHISNGRIELGIGAGWFEPEHRAYGFPFPSTGARFDEFEAQLAEIHRQWGEADDIWPKPLQRPRPPIIVGGRGLPRSVRAAVRYADEYNTAAPTLDQARERAQTVNAAARAAGRDPLRVSIMLGCVLGRDEAEVKDRVRAWQSVTKLVPTPQLSGTVEQVAEALRAYEAVGVGRAMLQHLVHDDVEMVGLLGELARELANGGGV
jgi:alkanesulfonate monooxygenase SsuD/methylene tetrahydromethanopterin reductase-like flavin-dependent oxidoreductase (luciferase family)